MFFTTHGLPSAEGSEQYGARWAREKGAILSDLKDRGIYFRPYGYYKDPDYGMTWETYEHATALLRRLHGNALRLLRFGEGELDLKGRQDTYVFERIV